VANAKPQYIHSQTFLDGDMWGAHDVVGVLLARGINQIAIAREGNEFTVSWPERNPPDVMHLPHDNPGVVA
jgi:hypothetical protein